MSLKKNIIANYASQIYVTIIGIVMLPMYISYMGAEAYGLVGFFTMLQVWFNLLDMGLTPTMARETARFRGGALTPILYRQFVRALEGIFFGIALVGGVALFLISDFIANDWLQASALSTEDVETSVKIIAVIVAIRWTCGLYRGAISGSERLVWLSGYNSVIATLRFVGVLPILVFISATPISFFSYQLGIAIFELLGLVLFSYRLLPSVSRGTRIPWSWGPVKPVLKFAITIAFTSSVWVFITQTDKLVLSSILPLAEYGYFTLAVLVASAVLMVSGPMSAAIMPRMARLEAENQHDHLIRVYRKATQIVAIIAGALSITLCFYAETLLRIWTGDVLLAQYAAPILILYAAGNGILAVSAFPYYLQYAKGDLRLHLIGNAIFVVMLIPLIIWATQQYGGIGAGYVWLGMNLLVFIVWLPWIHKKFAPGLNLKWYGQDVLIILLSVAVAGYGLSNIIHATDSNWAQLIELVFFGIVIMSVGCVASSEVRGEIKKWIQIR